MSGVTFSAQEFDILWSSLRLGTMPYPLAVSSHGRTLEERAEIRSAVYGRLAGRGLAADGLLERSIADQFGVLGRPEIAVDAVGLTDAPLRALAVSARGTAVLAVLVESAVTLRPIPEDSLAESVVGLLPATESGQGQSVSVRLDALRQALDGGSPAEDLPDDPLADGLARSDKQALIDVGMRPEDAVLLLRLADERIRGGQFGVSVVGRPGTRPRRAAPVISWFDTQRGRYLMTNDGTWLTVSPADSTKIESRVRQTIDELTSSPA